MADIIDEANAIDAHHMNCKVHSARRQLSGSGTDDCEDCGEPIPAARKKAIPSCTTCIECQHEREVRS